MEVVNDAMKNLVTKEYLTAELDRRFGAVDKRFTKMDAKMEVGFASMRTDMHRSQKVLIGLMMASTLAIIAMQITGYWPSSIDCRLPHDAARRRCMAEIPGKI